MGCLHGVGRSISAKRRAGGSSGDSAAASVSGIGVLLERLLWMALAFSFGSKSASAQDSRIYRQDQTLKSKLATLLVTLPTSCPPTPPLPRPTPTTPPPHPTTPHLGVPVCSWVLLGVAGCYWGVLGLIRRCWELLCATGCD